MISCADTHLTGPLPASRNILQDRQLYLGSGQGGGASGRSHDELENFFYPVAFAGADEGDRCAQLAGKFGGVDISAPVGQIVGHIQDHQRR